MGGMYSSKIIDDLEYEKTKKEQATKKMPKDSSDRVQIQEKIIELVNLGFPKDQILIRIKKEFPNSKHEEFFEPWVEHHYKNKDTQQKREKSKLTKFNYKGYER